MSVIFFYTFLFFWCILYPIFHPDIFHRSKRSNKINWIGQDIYIYCLGSIICLALSYLKEEFVSTVPTTKEYLVSGLVIAWKPNALYLGLENSSPHMKTIAQRIIALYDYGVRAVKDYNYDSFHLPQKE